MTVEQAVAAMAAEIGARFPALSDMHAWCFATGLLSGYRLGDSAAASSMMAGGDEDCRQLAREALDLQRTDFDPAALAAELALVG